MKITYLDVVSIVPQIHDKTPNVRMMSFTIKNLELNFKINLTYSIVTVCARMCVRLFVFIFISY